MILETLPVPRPGDRVTFMGNTGEGKTVTACALLLTQRNAIVLNTKHDPIFAEGDSKIGLKSCVDEIITRDAQVFGLRGGRFDFRPSDHWLQSPEEKDRFFWWALKAGNRVIYIDEFNDVAPSATNYPYFFQKAVKQGRWKKLGIWGSAQEPIRVPSFAFGQSQYRILYFLGWDPHRKAAEAWFQCNIDWSEISERSHKFFLKTPEGLFGPQPPLAFKELEIAKTS